ncbi:MAG: hypothetical protein JWN15_3034 [Firmicutes bacterium]|jgi:hypothetical protein|nr:hypothetical protein [Bacillota bacterium]
MPPQPASAVSVQPEQFPPYVRQSIERIFPGPPKPVVTPEIMNETQFSMIAPDLPNKADV